MELIVRFGCERWGAMFQPKSAIFQFFAHIVIENEILLELIIYRWNEDNIPMGICHMVT